MNGITIGDLKKELEKYPDSLDLWKAVGEVQTYTNKTHPMWPPSIYVGDHRLSGVDITGAPNAFIRNRTSVRIYDIAEGLLSVIAEANKKQK